MFCLVLEWFNFCLLIMSVYLLLVELREFDLVAAITSNDIDEKVTREQTQLSFDKDTDKNKENHITTMD